LSALVLRLRHWVSVIAIPCLSEGRRATGGWVGEGILAASHRWAFGRPRIECAGVAHHDGRMQDLVEAPNRRWIRFDVGISLLRAAGRCIADGQILELCVRRIGSLVVDSGPQAAAPLAWIFRCQCDASTEVDRRRSGTVGDADDLRLTPSVLEVLEDGVAHEALDP